MFIRRTASGETYHTYRLVENRREGDRIRQATLLNLGRHFDLAEEYWPGLCARLAQLLGGQEALVPLALPEAVETTAHTLAAQFVARSAAPTATAAEFVSVDLNSIEFTQPRSVGVEHVGLHALAQLVARMAAPGRLAIGRLEEMCIVVGST